MKKALRNQSDDDPVTLESLAKTLRDHTAAQFEMNSEFGAAICSSEEKTMSKIWRRNRSIVTTNCKRRWI